jgi:hypothetical protein
MNSYWVHGSFCLCRYGDRLARVSALAWDKGKILNFYEKAVEQALGTGEIRRILQ